MDVSSSRAFYLYVYAESNSMSVVFGQGSLAYTGLADEEPSVSAWGFGIGDNRLWLGCTI